METVVTKPKRLIVARFDKGEDLILTLKKCAKENKINAGYFSVIGGLKEFAFGLYEDKKYRNVRMTAKHCFELLATVGNISIKEGDVLIHAHIAACDEDGHALGGHLIEGSTVYPFAEVFIQECDANIDRAFDPTTNLWSMKLK